MRWQDIDWSEHRKWVVVDGAAANVVDVDVAGDSERAIVWIHGLGGNWQSWLANIPAFMGSHRCIAVDLPGFGYSKMPPHELSIPGYARWLAHLLSDLGVERATVVGNSMGGFIGADLAVNEPDLVEKLVLVNAAALWNERRRARPLVMLSNLTKSYATKFAAQWEMAHSHPRLRIPALAGAGARHPGRIPRDLAWEIMSGAGAPGFADALQALYDHRIREDLERISCPTLILWGTHDPLVPLRHAFEYEDVIAEARVVVFNDTGHIPMVEKPREFNAAVEDFMSERGLEAAEAPAAEVR